MNIWKSDGGKGLYASQKKSDGVKKEKRMRRMEPKIGRTRRIEGEGTNEKDT